MIGASKDLNYSLKKMKGFASSIPLTPSYIATSLGCPAPPPLGSTARGGNGTGRGHRSDREGLLSSFVCHNV